MYMLEMAASNNMFRQIISSESKMLRQLYFYMFAFPIIEDGCMDVYLMYACYLAPTPTSDLE